jgi:hypothetical protein
MATDRVLGATPEGAPQRAAFRQFQIKIRQSILDEIDARLAVPESVIVMREFLRRSDDGGQTVRLEQALEEHKLRIEILPRR